SDGIFSFPLSRGQHRIVVEYRVGSRKDRLFFGAPLVYELTRKPVRNPEWFRFFTMSGSDKTVSTFGPFQYHVRAIQLVKSEKPSVQPMAFVFADSPRGINPSFFQTLDSTTCDFFVRICRSDYHPRTFLRYDQISARRRLSMMAARLQIYVSSRFGPYRGV